METRRPVVIEPQPMVNEPSSEPVPSRKSRYKRVRLINSPTQKYKIKRNLHQTVNNAHGLTHSSEGDPSQASETLVGLPTTRTPRPTLIFMPFICTCDGGLYPVSLVDSISEFTNQEHVFTYSNDELNARVAIVNQQEVATDSSSNYCKRAPVPSATHANVTIPAPADKISGSIGLTDPGLPAANVIRGPPPAVNHGNAIRVPAQTTTDSNVIKCSAPPAVTGNHGNVIRLPAPTATSPNVISSALEAAATTRVANGDSKYWYVGPIKLIRK